MCIIYFVSSLSSFKLSDDLLIIAPRISIRVLDAILCQGLDICYQLQTARAFYQFIHYNFDAKCIPWIYIFGIRSANTPHAR